jgi:alkylmercury lyase
VAHQVPPTLDALATSLLAEGMPLGGAERAVALAAYRSLAAGLPLEVAALARAVDRDDESVRSLLARWPDVSYDSDGRIVAFWGLDLRETAHRFRVGGRSLFTWCAWDPLFLAPLLGAEARVESNCPVTAQQVVVDVGPCGVARVTPETAVLSFMTDRCRDGDVIARFCRFVLLFASAEAASAWTAEHPGTIVLGLDDAFELGRRMNAARFGVTPT